MPSTRPGSDPTGAQPRATSPEERGIVAAHQLRAALDLFGINFTSIRGDVPTTGKARVYLGISLAEDAERLTEILTHIGATPT